MLMIPNCILHLNSLMQMLYATLLNVLKQPSHKGLKLNSNKTEFLHISSRFRPVVPISTIDLEGASTSSQKMSEACSNLMTSSH